jgi:hypothetical protein
VEGIDERDAALADHLQRPFIERAILPAAAGDAISAECAARLFADGADTRAARNAHLSKGHFPWSLGSGLECRTRRNYPGCGHVDKHVCEICGGEGWVCEVHPWIAWDEGCGFCGGPGVPCQSNTSDPPSVNWAEVYAEVG